jgi:hypothetical protein
LDLIADHGTGAGTYAPITAALKAIDGVRGYLVVGVVIRGVLAIGPSALGLFPVCGGPNVLGSKQAKSHAWPN